MRQKLMILVAAGLLALTAVVPAFADQPPGQRGYEGQPGGGSPTSGYEGQPGNQGG